MVVHGKIVYSLIELSSIKENVEISDPPRATSSYNLLTSSRRASQCSDLGKHIDNDSCSSFGKCSDLEVVHRNLGPSFVDSGSKSFSKAQSSHDPPGNFKKSSENFQGKSSTLQRSESSRKKIGITVGDKLMFLKTKRESWDADKLIYELTGPNRENWEEIISVALENDVTGQLMAEVLKLLSHDDIRENPNANSLYIPLSNMRALQTYMATGLNSSMVATAVLRGRGSGSWIKVVDAALSVVETIASLMNKFVNCQSNPSVPIELLVIRIGVLLNQTFVSSQSHDEPVALDGWIPNISEDERSRFMMKAKHLSSRLHFIRRMHESAVEASLESIRIKVEDEREKSKEVKLANQRAKVGIIFLNDPLRDRDYLNTSVVPKSYELISNAPSSLPQNVVNSLSLNRSRGGHDDDDNFIDVNSSKVGFRATKQFNTLPRQEYRNEDHYLNTHFQLVREDCLAQLRRGISSFRGKLGADSRAIDIDVPEPDQVRKAAAAMMQDRSGDSGVYFYDNVRVRSVENCSEQDIGYAVTFDLIGSRKIDWTNTQRFMAGSLLCLSDGSFNERNLVVARVIRGVKEPSGE